MRIEIGIERPHVPPVTQVAGIGAGNLVVPEVIDVRGVLPDQHGHDAAAKGVLAGVVRRVLPERFHQIFIGRRNDPHVHLDRLRPTQSLEPLLLQHSEHLGLGRQAHIADFIQKQRAAVRHLKLSAPHHHCAGERALFVAEQFALNERLGDRGAVHLHEWTVGARAMNMDRPGH